MFSHPQSISRFALTLGLFLLIVAPLAFPSPTLAANLDAETPKQFAKEEAAAFATQVQQAIAIVCRRHFRELDEDQLLTWAIQGLYDGAKEKLPKEIEARLPQGLDGAGKKSTKVDLAKQIEGALDLLQGPTTLAQKIEILIEARQRLGIREGLDGRKDVELALRNVFLRLDGSAAFMDAASVKRMRAQQYGGQLGELGLKLARRKDDGKWIVATVFKNGPAHHAGVRVDDEIDRFTAFEDADGKSLPQPLAILLGSLDEEGIEQLLWGRLNEKIRVSLRRDGDFRSFDMARQALKRETIVGVERRADESWSYLVDAEHKIYYIRLLNYQRADLNRDLDRLLTQFEAEKIGGLVLDVRFTGSGLIDTAVAVADLFVEDGLLVEFRWRADGSGRRMGNRVGSHLGFPMACLVNSESGTCTEIVAGCLQDHGRAVIVGERTSGRASLQNYFPFDAGTLRITTSHAYRPSGKPLDRTVAEQTKIADWGVAPDSGMTLELPKEERAALGERLHRQTLLIADTRRTKGPDVTDRQREEAIEYLRRKTKATAP